MDEIDVIATRGRYVLGEAEDAYGVWDRERPGEPLRRFPIEEGGLGEAEAFFRRTIREDRLDRSLPRLCRWTFAVGVVVWILATAASGIVYSLSMSSREGFSEALIRAQNWSFFLVGVANAIWVASLATLAVLWLRRNAVVSRTSEGGRT